MVSQNWINGLFWLSSKQDINVPAKEIKDICLEKKSLIPKIICRRLQQDYEKNCLEDIPKNPEKQIKKEINSLRNFQTKTNGRLRKHS